MERSTVESAAAAKDRQTQIRQILGILHKWGIHTLGQFAALDKEELRARLGPEAVRLWERANGQSTRLLQFVQPPESFEESFEFENEIETAQPLFFMLRRFLEQLALRLSSIYLVSKELTLRIAFANPPQVCQRTDSSDWRNGSTAANKQTYERVFKIPQPTNDVDLLFRMLQTHLENFKADHPIVAVALTAQPIRPASQQFGLFETSLRNPYQLYETLARLTALLGTDRVGTPVLEETHRPDAFHLEPFAWNLEGTTSASSHYSSDTTERLPPISKLALRRFRAAPSASVFISGNIPAFLQSAKVSGKIADQRGPYSLSGNWWDERSWVRAEWDFEVENGILCRCHQSPPSPDSGVADGETWEIDGIYD
jgi:protein ImuB